MNDNIWKQSFIDLDNINNVALSKTHNKKLEPRKKIQKNKKTLNQLKNNIEKVKIIENHNKFKSLNDITLK